MEHDYRFVLFTFSYRYSTLRGIDTRHYLTADTATRRLRQLWDENENNREHGFLNKGYSGYGTFLGLWEAGRRGGMSWQNYVVLANLDSLAAGNRLPTGYQDLERLRVQAEHFGTGGIVRHVPGYEK